MPDLIPTFKTRWQSRQQAKHGSSNWHTHHKGKTTTERGYGAAWRATRKRIMERDHWLCQHCARAGLVRKAHDVDHIKPQAEGGTDDDDNLEAICLPHHKVKTQQEAERGRQRT
jgi:5-methylcytosine-specific restriction protein A